MVESTSLKKERVERAYQMVGAWRCRLGEPEAGLSCLWHRQNEMQAVTEADLGYRLFGFNDRVDLVPYLGAGLSEQSGERVPSRCRLRLQDFVDISFEASSGTGSDRCPNASSSVCAAP